MMPTIGYMVAPDLSLASYRYRVMIPSRELRKHGFSVQEGVGDVVVFSKHWSRGESEFAATCKLKGLKTVYDVCDDHFDDEHSEHYRAMISLVDRVTCPTVAMRDRIREVADIDAVVITDPYEYPLAEPRINTHITHVLWYGNPDFAAFSVMDGIGDRVLMCATKQEPPLKAHFMPWSRERMLMAFQWADAVIIPMVDSARNRCKSPNRLVEAVRQGRYVVSSDVGEYGRYGLFTGNIREGLDYIEKNRDLCILALRDAQNKVEMSHSPRVVGNQWAALFEEMLDGNINVQRAKERRIQLAQA